MCGLSFASFIRWHFLTMFCYRLDQFRSQLATGPVVREPLPWHFCGRDFYVDEKPVSLPFGVGR